MPANAVKLQRTRSGFLFLLLMSFLPVATLAQETYPNRPIVIVVPWAPGGAADFLARATAPKLSEKLGKPVLVENRPGSATNIGTEYVAKSRPDGHTLLMASSNNAVNMTMYPNLETNFLNAFVPVTNVGLAPNILVVHPAVPAMSVQELIALARAQPGKLTYGSSGNGSASHLAAEQFKKRTNVELLGIPYKGAGPAVADLVGGQISVMFTVIPATLGHVKSGRLRALAMASPRRLNELPDLPTVAESGVPGFESSIWYGIVVPAATPKAIVERLHLEISVVVKSKEISDRFVAQGTYPIGDTPPEFARTIASDVARYAEIIRSAGIKAE